MKGDRTATQKLPGNEQIHEGGWENQVLSWEMRGISRFADLIQWQFSILSWT